jgi:hypothetical protein
MRKERSRHDIPRFVAPFAALPGPGEAGVELGIRSRDGEELKADVLDSL